MGCPYSSLNRQSCLFVNVEEDQEIQNMVADYFNIENMGVRAAPPVESEDDVRAKQILHESTKRIEHCFQTGLLWKNDVVELPDSYESALSSLEGIERKMQRDQNFSAAYREVINGYIEKGYFRKVPPEDVRLTSERKWYLPHSRNKRPTKRQILSVIMSTFDPLGFLSYFIVGENYYYEAYGDVTTGGTSRYQMILM